MVPRLNRILCAGAVVRRENSVLLVRQSLQHDLRGQWSIPWGYVEPHESALEAALRECMEEANVAARPHGLMGIQELPHPASTALVFLCDYDGGAPKPDNEEVDAVEFFTARDLERSGERVEPWCEWLVRRALDNRFNLIPLNHDTPYRGRDAFF